MSRIYSKLVPLTLTTKNNLAFKLQKFLTKNELFLVTPSNLKCEVIIYWFNGGDKLFLRMQKCSSLVKLSSARRSVEHGTLATAPWHYTNYIHKLLFFGNFFTGIMATRIYQSCFVRTLLFRIYYNFCK